MFRFFKKVRISSINAEKFKKYLIYALGEIILVVIGILIALQINNWNEREKIKRTEHQYLSSINDEIIQDSLRLERGWFKNYTRKERALLNARSYIYDKYKIIDTIQFINDTGFGGIHSRASFFGQSTTFEEILNTGNLGNISSAKLRREISVFYNQKRFLVDYAKNIRTGYADKMNSLKSYNSSDPEYINIDEVNRILTNIKSDDFNSLLNQELSYTYSVNTAVIRFKSHCNQMNRQIEKYLKENFY